MRRKKDLESSGFHPEVEPVQELYAILLGWLVKIGLAAMFISFAIHFSGILPTSLDLARTTDFFHLSAAEFAEQTGGQTGWDWIRAIGDPRFLSFAAIVIFPAGMVLVITLAGVFYITHRNRTYALLAWLEAFVLIVAATGFFT